MGHEAEKLGLGTIATLKNLAANGRQMTPRMSEFVALLRDERENVVAFREAAGFQATEQGDLRDVLYPMMNDFSEAFDPVTC